jgi:Domain of unknown function (DUF4159)
MNRRRRIFVLALVLGLVAAAVLDAQRGRFGRQFGRPQYYEQNNPPPTEFVFARLHYGAGYRGGGGWYHDYPSAEEHILQIMKEASGINVDRMSYRIMELSSPEIFQYPFLYVSEPGEMDLTDQEVVNLREFILRGGFIMIDDFDADDWPPSLPNLRQNLKRAFPDREMFVLPEGHPLLHIYYDIDDLNVRHPMKPYMKGIFYGFPNEHGDLCMIICYNNDVGDYWEWIDQPRYALKPAAESLRLGMNFILYAMTH